MSNDYFQFKQFTIWQHRCGMKVGTDGTLLGAWARGGRRVLDVGTGTGLIALLMAQRYPEAQVVGIDIDVAAVADAVGNVAASPFAGRVTIEAADVRNYQGGPFDAIVSNPPFFVNSLESADSQRNLARHAVTLTFADLMGHAWRLLTDEGELSVVIPAECRSRLEGEAALQGFFKVREWAVRTTLRKPPRRYLLAFRKHSARLDRGEGVIGSEWYVELTKDFYL